jgi:cytochrome b561
MQPEPHKPGISDFARTCHAWSRGIHWATVAMMAAVLVTAVLAPIDPHGSGNAAFHWHSSLGLAVYVLAIARLFLWIAHRSALRVAADSKYAMNGGLRVAFYALLVALPLSGWVLAVEEGMSTHRLPFPVLPQWVHSDPASGSGSVPTAPAPRAASGDAPLVTRLSGVHAILGVALAFVIALHIHRVVGSRVRAR